MAVNPNRDHRRLDRKVYVLRNPLGEGTQLGYDDSYHAAGHVKKGPPAVTRLHRRRHLKEAGIIPRSAQGRNLSQSAPYALLGSIVSLWR